MTGQKKIKILKGTIASYKISNTTLPLVRPVELYQGNAQALVDASQIFGDEFKSVIVNLQDYQCID
jgi:hypothetical protein